MNEMEVYGILTNLFSIFGKNVIVVFQNHRKESHRVETRFKGAKREDDEKIEIILEKNTYSTPVFPRVDSLKFYPRGHKLIVPIGSNMENWSVIVNGDQFPARVEIR